MWTITQFFATLGDAVLVHLVLAFPTGWLMNRFDRVFVGANYITALLFQAAWLFFWDPAFPECDFCVSNVFVVVPDNEIAEAILQWASATVPIIAAIVLWRVWHRWRLAGPSGRRALLPLMVAVPFLTIYSALFRFAQTIERDEIRVFLLQPIFQPTSSCSLRAS